VRVFGAEVQLSGPLQASLRRRCCGPSSAGIKWRVEEIKKLLGEEEEEEEEGDMIWHHVGETSCPRRLGEHRGG
jgi:hypothetical protein